MGNRKSVGALLVIATSVLWVAAGPAAAAPARAPTVSPSALSMRPVGVTTVGVTTLSLDPGRSATKRVIVTNRSADLRLTVRLGPKTDSGSGSWLTLSDVVKTLEPGAHAVVVVKVRVPANAIPGDANVDVVARVEHAVRASTGVAVAGTPTVSLPFAINVKGAATAQVSVVNVRNLVVQGRDYLEITFQNVGATPMLMRGRVRADSSPAQVYPVSIKVAPLTSTRARVAWVKPSGTDGVTVAVDTNDVQGDQAAWTGTVGAPEPTTPAGPQAHQTATNAAVGLSPRSPVLAIVLIALGLVVLWFGYEVARAIGRRRTRRRRLEQVALIAASVAPGSPSPPRSGVVLNVSDEQVASIVAQLAALVSAIDRLTVRLDGAPVLPTLEAPVLEPSVLEPVPVPHVETVPQVEVLPVVEAPPVEVPVVEAAVDAPKAETSPGHDETPPVEGYPYDWPTAEQLDRFIARRRSVGTGFQ